MRFPLDRTDCALLVAYLLVAALGTWQCSLLVIDGAVFLTAAWLGNAWDLFFDQIAGRAVSTLFQFGPAWLLRPIFGSSSEGFLIVAHLLYFTAPLGIWLVLRIVEPQRLYARLYLAIALALIYFNTEMLAGIGLWLIWLAWIADSRSSRRSNVIATVLLTPAIAFTHPGIAILSAAFALVGLALIALGRPFPRRPAIAAGAMAAVLTAAYFVMSPLLPPGNPTVAAQLATAKYDYIDPVWMLATLGYFPMLAALWLLLIAPGLEGAALRWRLGPLATAIVGAIGVWFAFNGTNSLTWIFARQTALYALALALALALASPASAWLAASRLPLALFAAVIAVASVSYAIDLYLFGRAVDGELAALSPDAAPVPHISEIGPAPPAVPRTSARVYLKWIAAPDYVRDVVLPDYGNRRMTIAFYTFFRSGRRTVLYKPLARRGEWIPFECAPVDRALTQARDDIDRHFLRFLRERYCVPD
jgi:hypothetical protein